MRIRDLVILNHYYAATLPSYPFSFNCSDCNENDIEDDDDEGEWTEVGNKKKLYFDDCEEDDSGSEEEFENEDEDDEDGWITPANIGAKKKAMGLEFESGTQEQVDVACMTSDFAMQNVLIQVSNLNWMAKKDGKTIIRFIKLLGMNLLVNDTKSWFQYLLELCSN